MLELLHVYAKGTTCTQVLLVQIPIAHLLVCFNRVCEKRIDLGRHLTHFFSLLLRVLGLLKHIILGIGLRELRRGGSDLGSAQQRILVELDFG